jgi:hypothetical protein
MGRVTSVRRPALRAVPRPALGPSPTGSKRTSTSPIAACCSGRSAAWPKSPKSQRRSPSSEKQKIVFGPRCVPAASSCSEAIATTSPSGDSSVPAVERSTAGEPPTASMPL